MTEYNKDTAALLVAEAREDDERNDQDTLPARFMSKVLVDDNGCWLWQGSLNRNGYGLFNAGKTVIAHRYAYLTTRGEIDPANQLDHLCRVRCCVNPSHLEAVSARENNLRSTSPTSENAQKTTCKNGHNFDADNTVLLPGGRRSCRRCDAARKAKWVAENRERNLQHKRAYRARRQGHANV